MKQHYTLEINQNQQLTVKNALRHGGIVLLILFLVLIAVKSRAQVCCPQFRLQDAVEICPPDGACQGGSAVGGPRHGFVACRLITHQYTVYPNDPAFTYTWTITGGTPTSPTGNPVNITWGNGAQGFIKVIISNIVNGGSCKDSLLQEICLIPGPKADFTMSPDTVCVNGPVTFTNTSSGGSVYLWDFGDGTTSSLATPPAHSYSLPGNYTVTLTAANAGPAQQGAGTDAKPPCGCTDRISKTVVVLNGSGPTIDLSCCYGTVCPGDTSSFCTSVNCNTYNWTVAGGTIISGAGTSCIKVKWNAVYTVPTTVTLAVPGCGNAPCGGSTTIPVPVLYPNLPISGPNVLCVGEPGSYFLPTMPGTYYLWTTTAPPTDYAFNDQNKNTPNVNIVYSQPGTYVLQCQYQNPLAGCNGVSTIVIDVRPVLAISGDETVCEGSSVTYSVTSGTATWSATPVGATVPPGPSNTSAVIWTTPGTYTLSATTTTSGVFCNQTAIKVIKVIAKPVLGSITGPSPVCPGKNYTFSVTSNVSGSPFVWSVSNGTVMSEMGADKDSAVIKLNFPGSWTVSVYQKIEISPGVFCQSLSQTLNVGTFGPPAITGNGNVCVDAIETYTASGPVPPGGFQWAVIPPSQGSIITPNGGSSVNIQWHGTPNTAVVTVTTCGGTGTKNVTVLNPPFVGPISLNGPDGYCYPNLPNNLVLSTTPGFPSYQWYYNNTPVGTNSPSYSVPNVTFTGMGSYLFTVAVSNGTCSVLRYVIVHVDSCAGGGGGTPTPFNCAVDFTMNPNPACVNEPVVFTAIGSPGFSYAWSFGDGYTSFQSPTQHEYANAGTDTVTLVATYGTCVVTKKKVITINPKPFCLITAVDTIFCPGSSVALTACNEMNSYQWYLNGVVLPNDTNQTCNASKHGEYEVEVTNGYGCTARSNSLYIYMNSLPKADITGEGSVCSNANAYAGFQLNAFYDTKYKYDWSSNAGGATFTPNNSNAAASTIVGLTLPGTLPVTYFFVVKVTDTVTMCESRDTLCVTFFETPPLNMVYTAQCEGSPVTFAAIPAIPSLYNYTWSSGQTTPSITVSAPGAYSVTVTDKLNGCSIFAPAGVIYPLPDLRLFPLGCDSILCNTDTIQMYIPLPLNWQPPNNVYPNAYPTITWYDNGNYGTPIAFGQNFPFAANAGGSHQLSVVVQTNHGCSDTAGVYCVTVLCGDLEFAHCPSAPIVLPCNSTAPTVADALTAAGPATSTCPGPVNVTVTGGTPISIGGCTWLATYTLTATDACGGILVCNVTFKWKEDHEPPYFSSCPSGAVMLPCNAPHPTTADALALVGPVMDNCPGSVNTVVTGGTPVPTSGCYWTATFTITATDGCGNVAVCNVVYNWKEDLVPPQFAHCPTQPINLPCNITPNQEELLYEIGPITDNCLGQINVQVTGGVPVPTTGCRWTSTYTITATDSCGNVNICSVTYNWKMDNQPPQFAHCPAGPISLPCNAPHPTETDALAAAGAITDNCPGTIIQVTGGVPTQTTGCSWTATFVISASDSCGNTSSCSVTYNWKEDLIPPQFTHCPTQPITLPCNVMPNQEELLYEIGPITDNCQAQVNVQISGGVPVPTTGCSWTTTYTITATDSCGNINVCTVTYNWTVDNQPPQFAHCPAGPVSLFCNATPTTEDALASVGAITDNCGGQVSVSVSSSAPVPLNNCGWSQTFTVTATDACGNQSQCQVVYHWTIDQLPPVFAHCPTRTIILPCNSPRPETPEAILAAGPVTDNCYVDFLQVTDGGVIPLLGCWFTQTFSLTATDGCGNVSTCQVTYRWKEDHTAPVFAHCPTSPIDLPCNPTQPTVTGALAAAGPVTDNCPGVVVLVNCLPPVDTHYDSPEQVTYTTAYSIRNFSLQSFSDCYVLPAIIGQPETHTYSSTASFEISSDGGNSWTPIQSPASVTMQITKTDEDPVQSYYSTEILDMNISGTSVPEGVMIRESPTLASTGELIVQQGSEEYTISSFFDVFTELSSNGGQTWNVAVIPININLYGPIILQVTPGPVTPTTGCGFTQTFSMTATDACGNVGNCSVTYNWKVDHTPPVFAHCPEAPINLGCNPDLPTAGMAQAAAGAVTDNCPGNIFLQVQSGPIMEHGLCGHSQTFTIIATDACGNETVCSVTYLWKEDHIKPTFTRPADITLIAGPGGYYNASVAVTGDVTDEQDNCTSGLDATYTDVVVNGGIPVLNIITRTWHLTDPCGNIADDQVQTITVVRPSGHKILTMSLLLEGLYNGSGLMNKAQDEQGNHFPADIADMISVELHNESNYSQVVYSSNLTLSTWGVAALAIPNNVNGSYFITIKHRSSVETTSSVPISFAGSIIEYSFDLPGKAYGGNLKQMIDDQWVVYCGDLNGDGFVDTNDMSEVDNLSALFGGGYVPQDINGDGIIDTSDMITLDNNASEFVSAIIP